MTMDYIDFLKQKQIQTQAVGFESSGIINKNMFDWQRELVRWALKKGRAAFFEDCGLGKTLQGISWGQQIHEHTNKDVLMLAPLGVTQQTKDEGEKFGIEINIARNQKEIKKGVNVVNYEMLKNLDPWHFSGIILDEASILKSYMGKTKMQIIDAFRNTPYKLPMTATPAPNDHMEILNQAEFLGVMRSAEALAMFFINDTQNMGTYRLKQHAVKPFWEWVSTWAICMSKPSDIGYSDEGYILPKLHENIHTVDIDEIDDNFENGFLRKIETSATGYHKEKRMTAKDRTEKVVEIAHQSKDQYVIWVEHNSEADLVRKYIPEAIEISGADKLETKEERIEAFKKGQIRVLISKPTILGYGLNFQNCHRTIFNGLSYSYESYYQAIRRFHRFGQAKNVEADIVIGSTEMKILESNRRKAALHAEMSANMYNSMKEFQEHNIKGQEFTLNLQQREITKPSWLKQVI